MYLQIVISRKNCVKKLVFCWQILKVNNENSRNRIQDLDPDPNPDPNPDPDPLVRGMDPRIRIRLHPKMSWIRNTARSSFTYDQGNHWNSSVRKAGWSSNHNLFTERQLFIFFGGGGGQRVGGGSFLEPCKYKINRFFT
jgi:hypothetical protein